MKAMLISQICEWLWHTLYCLMSDIDKIMYNIQLYSKLVNNQCKIGLYYIYKHFLLLELLNQTIPTIKIV